MPTIFCCILIVAVGTFNSSFAASRESWIPTAYRASVKEKKGKGVRGPTPLTIWRGIKVAAQNEARSASPLIIAPRFMVTYVGETPELTIVKGDVVTDLGFRDDPYDLPFRKQILIESLRRVLADTDLAKTKTPDPQRPAPRVRGSSKAASVGQPYLLSAEKLVRQTVIDIESEPNKDSLKEKLRAKEKQIDELLYDKIYQAVEQEAQANGYNIIYGRGGASTIKFSVNITTVPDGAKVWVMTNLVYRQQVNLRTNASRWPWIEIVQIPYQLLGKYRYRTIWRDGRHAEGDINVVNASPIRFLPN